MLNGVANYSEWIIFPLVGSTFKTVGPNVDVTHFT
jgi:hypothetical protein